jgi:hypothetical protein
MEHRIEALHLIDGVKGRIKEPMTHLQMEGLQLVLDLAKIHALLAIEDRLRELKSRI